MAYDEVNVGDVLDYLLEQGLTTTRVEVTVKSKGPKRIVVYDKKFNLKRIIGPNRLARRLQST